MPGNGLRHADCGPLRNDADRRGSCANPDNGHADLAIDRYARAYAQQPLAHAVCGDLQAFAGPGVIREARCDFSHILATSMKDIVAHGHSWYWWRSPK